MVRWSGGREVGRCHVCTVLLVQVMNAACTARPAVIVVPNTSEDVAAVVRAASSSGLELSVRSGGHSYTCTNLKEGGVHVDMRSAPASRSCRSLLEFFKYSANAVIICNFNVEIWTLVHRTFTKRTKKACWFLP